MNPHSETKLRLSKLWWVLGIGLLGFVLAICLTPLKLPPSQPMLNDKFWHVLTFIVLTVWFGGLLRDTGTRHSLWLIAAMVSFGLLIEFLQSFTAYRSPEAADVVADVIGVLAGIVLLRLGFVHWARFIEQRVLRLQPDETLPQ